MFAEEIGNVSKRRNILNARIQNKCIDIDKVHDFVDVHLGPNCSTDSEIYKRYVTPACGSGCAHPVSLALPLSIVCSVLVRDDRAPRRAIFCLCLTILRSRYAIDFDLLAVLLNVGINVFTTLLPWRTRWLMPSVLRWRSRQDQAASLPVTLAESCSIKAVADAVAHAGLPPGGLHGPGALELRVTRIIPCTSLRWTLALWRGAPWFSAEGP